MASHDDLRSSSGDKALMAVHRALTLFSVGQYEQCLERLRGILVSHEYGPPSECASETGYLLWTKILRRRSCNDQVIELLELLKQRGLLLGSVLLIIEHGWALVVRRAELGIPISMDANEIDCLRDLIASGVFLTKYDELRVRSVMLCHKIDLTEYSGAWAAAAKDLVAGWASLESDPRVIVGLDVVPSEVVIGMLRDIAGA